MQRSEARPKFRGHERPTLARVSTPEVVAETSSPRGSTREPAAITRDELAAGAEQAPSIRTFQSLCAVATRNVLPMLEEIKISSRQQAKLVAYS